MIRGSGQRGQPSQFEATAPRLKRLTAEAAYAAEFKSPLYSVEF